MQKLFPIILMSVWVFNIHAQSSNPEIVSTSGETFQANSIQLDWTLGELAITTIQSSSQQITQGFHQANYEITSVDDFPEAIGVINVYPNPTSDRILMALSFEQTRDVQIQLLDLNGKLIWANKSFGDQIVDSMEIGSLPNGSYLLHFLIDNKFPKTFKIQKHN